MQSADSIVPHKYDTYIPLNYPPMKASGFEGSQKREPAQHVSSDNDAGTAQDSGSTAQQESDGEFIFHLGGLRMR